MFTSTLIHNCSKGFIKDQNSLKLTLKAIGCESNWSPISHGKCNTCFDPLSGLTHNPVFKVTFQGQTGKLFSLTCTSKLFTTFNLAIRFTGFTAELHAMLFGHLLKCQLEASSCCIVLGIAETMHLQHMLVALEIRPTCRRNQHDQKLHQVLWFYPQHTANLQLFMRWCPVSSPGPGFHSGMLQRLSGYFIFFSSRSLEKARALILNRPSGILQPQHNIQVTCFKWNEGKLARFFWFWRSDMDKCATNTI